jgi:hypothetical protein
VAVYYFSRTAITSLRVLHLGNNRTQGPFQARERDLGCSGGLVHARRRNHPETRSRPPETYSRPHAHTGHHKPQLGRPDTIGPDSPDSPDSISPDSISPDSTKKRAAQGDPSPTMLAQLGGAGHRLRESL